MASVFTFHCVGQKIELRLFMYFYLLSHLDSPMWSCFKTILISDLLLRVLGMAREMAQSSRTCIIFMQEPSSIHSPHIREPTTACDEASGGASNFGHMHIHMQT